MAQGEDGPSQRAAAQPPWQPWAAGALAASPRLAAQAVLWATVPKASWGCVCCPAFRGEGREPGGGAAGGGGHCLDQADSSHVLWATVQEQPQAHTVSVGDAGGLWAATAKKSCPLHGLGPHLAFLLPRAQLAPTGVREMGGTGSPRRPSVGLRGRSLGPRGPRGETVLQRGAATHVQ